jgi:hypothetical protein
MPEKHPNTKRWGGPGASHEDRTKPIAEPQDVGTGGSTNPSVSRVSGGGGERDRKHSHMDDARSSKQDNTDMDTKPNRPRHEE